MPDYELAHSETPKQDDESVLRRLESSLIERISNRALAMLAALPSVHGLSITDIKINGRLGIVGHQVASRSLTGALLERLGNEFFLVNAGA